MNANANGVSSEACGGCVLVRLRGEVDLSWSPQVRRALLDALAQADAVGVDLSAVGYIDSSGIAALVEGLQYARTHGQRFVLVAVSDAVRAVLELARLDRVFTLVASPDEVTAPA
jgi:anti-sigma B factor antagonist